MVLSIRAFSFDYHLVQFSSSSQRKLKVTLSGSIFHFEHHLVKPDL